MHEFGDITDDDIFDTSPPNAEAVARKYYDDLRNVSGDDTRPRFDDLEPSERVFVIAAFLVVLGRLKREGALRG